MHLFVLTFPPKKAKQYFADDMIWRNRSRDASGKLIADGKPEPGQMYKYAVHFVRNQFSELNIVLDRRSADAVEEVRKAFVESLKNMDTQTRERFLTDVGEQPDKFDDLIDLIDSSSNSIFSIGS